MDHRRVEEGINREPTGKKKGGKEKKETKEKNRQEGESNRQQTIYRALNYFISTVQPFDLGMARISTYDYSSIRNILKIDKRDECDLSVVRFEATEENKKRRNGIQVCAIVN